MLLEEIKRRLSGSRNANIMVAANLQKVPHLVIRCGVFYPRVAERVGQLNPDPWLRSQLLQMGAMMTCSSDDLANLISELGHDPRWSVDCAPDELEAPHFFRGELARISKAISLLREAMPLAKIAEVRQGISQLIVAKEHHLQELREVQTSLYAEAT